MKDTKYVDIVVDGYAMKVCVDVDWRAIAHELAQKAHSNKSGKACEVKGAVVVRVLAVDLIAKAVCS